MTHSGEPTPAYFDSRLHHWSRSQRAGSIALTGTFDHLVAQRNVVVTTFKRDGEAVATPVHVVVEGDHGYFRTWSTSGKAKRLRANSRLLIAPSTFRGKPTGASISAVARLLSDGEEGHVRELLTTKYPLLQGRLVPFAHRMRHYSTIHYELSDAQGEGPSS